jgi:2-methylcitrate dehydratase
MDRFLDFLSSYGSSLTYGDLPKEVIHEVKRRLIDSLACAMGAYEAPPSKIARSLALEVSSTPGSTVLGSRHSSSPELATFANGVMVRYLDYSDACRGSDSKEGGHPSDNIPAVLSVAEYVGSDPKTVLTAVALAYEVQGRLSDSASLQARGWDHVAYVAFSSVMGAGKVLGLGKKEMAQAIALAAIPNIPLRQTRRGELSMWKGCAGANSARNGVFCALLASKGLTGPQEAFEGHWGFLNQVTGPMELPPFGGNARPYRILDTKLKFFPAEGNSHCTIHAALELRKQIANPTDIESVVVTTYDHAVGILADTPEKWRPSTRETADHSLPYIVSVALADGVFNVEQFAEERIRDPQIQALMKKVKVERDQEFTKSFPRMQRTRVEVITRTGRLAKEVSYPRGDPMNPMDDSEVEDKFRHLTKPLLNASVVDRALESLWHFEEAKSVKEVLRLFAL